MARLENEIPEGHRKKLIRYDSPGDARFLTFSCFKRQPFLSKDRSRRWFLDALEISRETHGFDLWAWVIMPEHVHLLVYPGHAPFQMKDALYSLKKSVTNTAQAYVRRHAPQFLKSMEDRQPNRKVAYRFWQRGGGYDRNLWTPAEIWEKIDYIHKNPVTRELCNHPLEWPWSSARAFSTRKPDPIRIDLDSIPRPPDEYRPPF